MHQLDMKSVFFNGPLEEEVNVKQPPCFKIKEQEENAYMLKGIVQIEAGTQMIKQENWQLFNKYRIQQVYI